MDVLAFVLALVVAACVTAGLTRTTYRALKAKYQTEGASRSASADAYRQPFLAIVTVSGLLIPLSGATFLFGDVELGATSAALSVAAAVVLLVAVIVSAFGVAEMATQTDASDAIHLDKDYWAPGVLLTAAFISAGMGFILVLSALGLELNEAASRSDESMPLGPGTVQVTRSLPALGAADMSVRDALGAPEAACPGGVMIYGLGAEGTLQVTVAEGVVQEVRLSRGADAVCD